MCSTILPVFWCKLLDILNRAVSYMLLGIKTSMIDQCWFRFWLAFSPVSDICTLTQFHRPIAWQWFKYSLRSIFWLLVILVDMIIAKQKTEPRLWELKTILWIYGSLEGSLTMESHAEIVLLTMIYYLPVCMVVKAQLLPWLDEIEFWSCVFSPKFWVHIFVWTSVSSQNLMKHFSLAVFAYIFIQIILSVVNNGWLINEKTKSHIPHCLHKFMPALDWEY